MMDRPIKKKKWGLKRIFGLLMIGGIVFIAVYYFFYQDKSSKLNVHAEKIIISTVSKDSFQEFIPILGKVQPVTMVYLDAMEGGRVEKKFQEAGDWVKEGDKIIELSNTTLVLNLAQREAEYFNQKDILQKSRLSMEQYRLNNETLMADLEYQIKKEKRLFDENSELFDKRIISRQKYLTNRDMYEYLLEKKRLSEKNYEQEIHLRKVNIEQAELSLERMNSYIDIIRERLDKLTIRASISGQLTVLNAEIGQSKIPGQRLGEINMMKDLKVRAGIDEHYISRIEKGKMGSFEFAGIESELEIQKIFPQVREGQFQVDMKFTAPLPKGIRIGQTLHIKLTLGDLTTAIIIPKGGFFQSTAGQWIYVLDGSNDMAIKRKIKIGRQNTDFFEILEGLESGEKVITSSYNNFEKIDKLILK
ncbi:MAG: efflux RND transporter periplasmic adaptor subunit [Desulfobacteraceae bacterium]|nr:efflux RND transporter periplasmic adaptor subunit [Desulfobacteraceae bacterium]